MAQISANAEVTARRTQAITRAQAIIDDFWRQKSDTFVLRANLGRPIETFPDLSEQGAQHIAAYARTALAAMDTVDMDALPHELALTLKHAAFQLGIEAQAADRYWLAQDFGFFPAMFPVGPYGSSYLFTLAARTFNSFSFEDPSLGDSHSSDSERYLALIENFSLLVGQIGAKLVDQSARGIHIPRPALTGVRDLVSQQAKTACDGLERQLSTRIRELKSPGDFLTRVHSLIETSLKPQFCALLEFLSDDYAARAPETVGMAQFPGGGEAYEALVAEHLSMPMTIDGVYQAGHERIAQIEAQMAEIRSSLGYPDRSAFHRYLLTDSHWVAQSPEQIQARFEAAIHRIEPKMDSLFALKPIARYRTARLDPKLEPTMTYGYYQEPVAGHPDGVYYFNGANASERTLATAAALIFHELIPGHHLHAATQKENRYLHPIRQHLFYNAFTEGWAEYAATLAGEIGMYADPCERYGRMLMDAFLTCRLVVDTGMNALGWSLGQARQFLRDHTILSQAEIASETLRYSTDIPAQSLAYKFGEIKIHQLRDRVQFILKDRFDIRTFHDIVLGSGAMPLATLEWRVNEWLSSRVGAKSSEQGEEQPRGLR